MRIRNLLLRCSLSAGQPGLILSRLCQSFALTSIVLSMCLSTYVSLSLHFITPHVCLSSLWSSLYPLSSFFSSYYHFSSSAATRRCNLGGVSSGQSYPSAQYESGLQQRGQQGEQPGHQPHTLLHSTWWVAAVDSHSGEMSSVKSANVRMISNKKEKL